MNNIKVIFFSQSLKLVENFAKSKRSGQKTQSLAPQSFTSKIRIFTLFYIVFNILICKNYQFYNVEGPGGLYFLATSFTSNEVSY